ncbi:hypothetical protein Ddc_10074 [Ditylenchus destructor]|nr:hypothetical protein Ddc_10074 [Ditylenchus destructor]
MATIVVSQSGTRIFGPDDQQQECMGLVLPDKRASKHNLALSTTQTEMPNSVQTMDRPVVVMVAPKQVIVTEDAGPKTPDTTNVCEKLQNLNHQ